LKEAYWKRDKSEPFKRAN